MSTDRQSIYINRKSLSEYLRGNALNYELHHLFEAYLHKNSKDVVIPKMTELFIFNELYYRLTWISNIDVIVEEQTPIDKAYIRRWYRDMSNEIQSKDAAEFIGCLVVGVFSIMPKRTAPVTLFSKFLEEILRKSKYNDLVKNATTAFKKSFGTLILDFPLATTEQYTTDPQGVELERMQKKLEEALMQTEEYKKAIADLKRQVGSTSIPVDVIAKCILRLPTKEAVWATFKEVNTLLVGTVWSSYAEKVLDKIIEKYSDTSQPSIYIQQQYGPVNGDVTQQSIGIPENLQKSLAQ